MRRVWLCIAAASSLALALVGCGSSDSGVTTENGRAQVTVGVIPILDVAPVYLGEKKGFFRKRKIDLKFATATGGAAIVPGVMNGDFQIGFSNYTSLLVARDKGLPLKVVAHGVSSTGVAGKDFSAVVVRGDSPIRTAADLAGKRVSANNLKNIGDTTVRASIRKAGGDADKVGFVEMPLPDMPAALRAGQVDAAWVVEPQLSQTLAQGARIVASNFVDAAPNLSVAGYFTSEKVLRTNADLIDRFTAAIEESLAYADAHPDEVRQVLATYTKINPALIPKLTLPTWPTEVDKDSVATLARLATDDKLLTKAPDLDGLYA